MQAERKNESKPDLAYLLSFVGGVELVEWPPHMEAVSALGEWYRGNDELSLEEIAVCFTENLRPDWPELLAQVCTYGEGKYSRGNYLNGFSWHKTCSCLLRHVRAKARGEIVDPETGIDHDGAIAWNVCALVHNAYTHPEFDDRLRAPT